MEQQARVRRVYEDGTALVVHVRQNACSGDCHQCGGCGAVTEQVSVVAANPQGAEPGELVLVRSRSGKVLMAAWMLYILPVVLFFAGYWLGAALWNMGAVTGCAAFALGVGTAVIYDRLAASKAGSGYVIFRYPQTIEKGDNDFD